MESKICNTCKVEKSLDEFGKNNATKDLLNHKCKACVREYNRLNKDSILLNLKNRYKVKRDSIIKYALERQAGLKDGYHSVYLLPIENYVGVTDNLTVRKSGHKYYGRETKGMRVLAQFNNRKDALELEQFLHELGYIGASNTYK